MATININRVPKVNSETGRVEVPTLIINENGVSERQIQLIETDSIQSISGNSIISEDISSQLENSKILNYISTNNFKDGSLSVFYNGLNITKDITINSDNDFSLPSEYQSIISVGDSLLLIYTKK